MAQCVAHHLQGYPAFGACCSRVAVDKLSPCRYLGVLPLQSAASQACHPASQVTLREVTHQQRHFDMALADIEAGLQLHGKSLRDLGLPEPHAPGCQVNKMLMAELSYDRAELQRRVDRETPLLNPDQQAVVSQVKAAIDSFQPGHVDFTQPKLFFVDGPGGTGKTFTYNHLLAWTRAQGKVALAVASSGLAAQLLEGGTTAHYRFKVPVCKLDDASTCK